MSTNTINELLLCDTGELVLRDPRPGDPLLVAWRIAADDARDAYADWCAQPSALTYAAYLALADQADAAADTRARAAVPAGPHAPLPLAA